MTRCASSRPSRASSVRACCPTCSPEPGITPEYNTADASLWFFEAWRAYVEATGDVAALREVLPGACAT